MLNFLELAKVIQAKPWNHMKYLLLSICLLGMILESHAQKENYAKVDSLIHLNDSLGRYFEAEKAAKEGLALAENENEIER